jgi:pyruvate/2-oxoglutarate dehydrogenase complex dihydrolipoamide acyltransferase (E2) component
MRTPVNLPKSGMGIDEGTVARWLKAEGDKVRQGEIIVEVESAKAIQEVEAPASGTLIRILVKQGETTPVDTALAEIDDSEL